MSLNTTKEHRKLYKAKKMWTTATLFGSAVVLTQVVNQQQVTAHADEVSSNKSATNDPNSADEVKNSVPISGSGSEVSSASAMNSSNTALKMTATNTQNSTTSTVNDSSVVATNTTQSSQSNSSQSQSGSSTVSSTSNIDQNATTTFSDQDLDNSSSLSIGDNDADWAKAISDNKTTDNDQSGLSDKMSLGQDNPITTQNDTTLTPNYHLSTPLGGQNDIQTIWQDSNGLYHVYYLSNPALRQGGDTSWQEATSPDLVNWTNVDGLSIKDYSQDHSVPWGSVATGSVVTSDGTIAGTNAGDIVAYFSSYGANNISGDNKNSQNVHFGGQSIWAAVSKDNGKTFVPLNNRMPVIANSNDYANFRDSHVTKYNGKWVMYTAEGDKIGTYNSNDGMNWWYVGGTMMNNGAFQNRTGDYGLVECPVIQTMTADDGTTHDVMFFGGNDYVTGHTTGTFYMTGHLDANGVFTKDSDPQVLDGGTDYYGANFGKMNNGQVVTAGWVSNWGYAFDNITSQFGGTTNRMGSMSLVRNLNLIHDTRPDRANSYFLHSEVVSVPSTMTSSGKVNATTETDQTIQNNAIANYEFKSKDGSRLTGTTTIHIGHDDEAVDFYLDFDKGTITSSRWSNLMQSSNDIYKKAFAPSYMGIENRSDVRLAFYTDTNSIEIQNLDTKLNYTVERYSSSNKTTQNVIVYPVANADLYYSLFIPNSVLNKATDEANQRADDNANKLNDANNKLNDANNKLNDMQNQLNNANSTNNSNQAAISSLQKQLSDSQNSNTLTQNQLSSLQQKLSDATNTNSANQTTISNLQKQLSDAQSSGNLSQNQIQSLQKQLQDAQSSEQASAEQIKTLQQQVTNLTNENKSLKDVIVPNYDNLSPSQRYHLHSEVWSGDVQTITYDETTKTYNVYYLKDSVMIHRQTKDFVNYTDEQIATPKTDNQDYSDVWTGSIVTNNGQIQGAPNGAQVFYFTGLKKSDGSQNIYASWSSDNGATFTNQLNNGQPILTTSNALNNHDLRDPFVGYYNGKMLMYTSEGDRFGVYNSTDGIHWVKADPNSDSKRGPYSNFFPVEVPVIRIMKQDGGGYKAVLFFSAQNQGHPESSASYYMVGTLDSNGFFNPDASDHQIVHLDEGTDFYANNFSGSADLSQVNDSVKTLGWIGNWGYTASDISKNADGTGGRTRRQAAYSLVRNLTLGSDGKIHATPNMDGITGPITFSAHNAGDKIGTDNRGDINLLQTWKNEPTATLYDINMSNTDGSKYTGRTYLDIVRGADKIRLNMDAESGIMMVTRNGEELKESNKTNYDATKYSPFSTGGGNTFHFKVFTDNSSIEIFFPDGTTYTLASYADVDSQDVTLSSENDDGATKHADVFRTFIQNGGTVTSIGDTNALSSQIADLQKKLQDAQMASSSSQNQVNNLQQQLQSLNNQLNQATQDGQTKQSIIDSLKNQISQVSGQLSDSSSKLDQANKVVQDLSGQLNQANTDKAAQAKTITDLQNQLASSGAALSSANANVSDLTNQLQKLNQALKDTQATGNANADSLRQQVQDVTAKLQQATSDLSAKQSALDAANKALSDANSRAGVSDKNAQAAIDRANQTSSDAKAAESAANQAIADKNQAIADKNQAINDKNSAIADKNAAVVAQQAAQAQIDSLTKQLDQVNSDKSSLSSQLQQAQSDLARAQAARDQANNDLQAANGNNKDLQSKLDSANASLNAANATVNAIKQQLDAANSAQSSLSDQLKQSQTDLSNANTQLAAANKKAADAQAQANDLQSKLDDANKTISTLQSNVNDLTNQMNSLKTQLDTTNKALNDARTNSGNSDSRVNDLVKQVSDLNNQLNDLNGTLTDKQNALNTSNQQLADLQTQLQNAKNDSATKSSQLDQANQDKQSLQSQLDQANKNVTAAQKTIDTLNAQIKQLQDQATSDASNNNATNSANQDVINGLKKDLAAATSQLDQANQNVSALNSQLNDKNAIISDLTAKLNAANANVQNLANSLQQAKNDSTTLQNELNDANSQKTALSAQVNDLQNQLTASKNESASLRDQITQLNKQRDDAAAQITALQGKLDSANDALAKCKLNGENLQKQLDQANKNAQAGSGSVSGSTTSQSSSSVASSSVASSGATSQSSSSSSQATSSQASSNATSSNVVSSSSSAAQSGASSSVQSNATSNGAQSGSVASSQALQSVVPTESSNAKSSTQDKVASQSVVEPTTNNTANNQLVSTSSISRSGNKIKFAELALLVSVVSAVTTIKRTNRKQDQA